MHSTESRDPPPVERIATRGSVIGDGLAIRRALPGPRRRMVGAWCFLDHAGPMDYAPGQGMNIGPHPHIGLQTFTWMIEGEILHRDSLGYEQLIRPGQVNLMTAGQGIAHAEDRASDAGGRLHVAQLWIALPDAERHRAPAFEHHPQLPVIDTGGFRITVLAGTAFGQSSPATLYSPLLGLDLSASAAAAALVPLNPAFEHAALVLRGSVAVAGESLEPGTLLYLGSGRGSVDIRCDAAAQLLLLGGTPFGEEILLWWNFVARTQAELEAATRDWNEPERRHGRFGTVHGSPSPALVAPSLAGLQLKPAI